MSIRRSPLTSRNVHVFLRPPEPSQVQDQTSIVIDTLRATTVITTLMAGGAAAIYPSAGVDEARALAHEIPGAQLCGERGGLPPEGFAFGNSAVEFHKANVAGWTMVQCTSNGTRALRLARAADRTLVGCLRNRDAVARAVLEIPGDIAIVCSGEDEGQRPSVEDTFTAGAVVETLVGLEPGVALGAGARLARRIFQAYGRNGTTAFQDAPHAEILRGLGFHDDLAFAAQMDVEGCVPVAFVDDEARIRIARAPS
jgi:2-phosphosulfolactate phosphatase